MQVRAADPMGFAISQVIPNRPIAQEVDRSRQREILRWLIVGSIVVAAALFDAAQRQGITTQTFRLGEIQTQRAAEAQKARHLRLELATVRAPARIDELARQLNMVAGDAIVLQRVIPPAQPPSSVVAAR
ncbi:MAG: hypothetical protein EHM24_29030 [Acidobacteria bacterium]|nr:MAG: hypothetical protein EHM24_29030 [Acidobacteriota bacterium]RPJ82217.1 MAG: hypothetical protein EHM13_09270 [Acidobacteriota bacterium]